MSGYHYTAQAQWVLGSANTPNIKKDKASENKDNKVNK